MALMNADVWFRDPFSPVQMFSWAFLRVSNF
jgi:hypothetical protein